MQDYGIRNRVRAAPDILPGRILRRKPEWIGVGRANRDNDNFRHKLFSTAYCDGGI